MTLWEHYLRYLSELCEGTRTPPAGYVLTATDPMERAMELQGQIGEDIPGFVRACAGSEGIEIPSEAYDSFDLAEVMAAAAGLADRVAETSAIAEADTKTTPDDPPEEEPPRHAFEIFLDSVLLEDELVGYLIDVLKRQDDLGFFKLSQVAARADLDPRDFLYWLGHKESYADEEERACAAVLDACLDRLLSQGQGELAAALISGEKAVFETFRCEAPELVHLPIATYEWFEKNYLERYYPIRFILRANGIAFPDTLPKKD